MDEVIFKKAEKPEEDVKTDVSETKTGTFNFEEVKEND